MILEALLGSVVGALGAAPFVHTNLILQFFSNVLQNPIQLAVFSVAVSVSHAIFEIFPMLMIVCGINNLGESGKFGIILKICAISFVLCLLFVPFFAFLLPEIKNQFPEQLKYLFLAVVVSQFAFEKRNLSGVKAVFVFLLCGILGLIVFNKSEIAQPLFPLLSGFFALPVILFGIKPENEAKLEWNDASVYAIAACVAASALSSLFPALTCGVLLGVLIILIRDEEKIAVMMPALLVSKAFYDIAAAAIYGKTRSYAAVLAMPLSEFLAKDALLVICTVSIVSASVAFGILFGFSKKIAQAAKQIEGRGFKTAAFFAIALMIAFSSGFLGILLAFCACCLGVFANEINVRKSALMGALIFPSLGYQFGFFN